MNNKANSLFSLAAIILAVSLAACGGGEDAESPTSASSTSQSGSVTSSTLVTAVSNADYGTTAEGLEKANVFAALNEDRARCGFGLLAQNTKLDIAAQAHADYVKLNAENSHNESAGMPGFTGIAPVDRGTAAGYTSASYSEMFGSSIYGTAFASSSNPAFSAAALSARNTLRILYASVYHLEGLMNGNLEAGLGVAVRDNSAGGTTAYVKTLVVNSAVPGGGSSQNIAGDAMATFPCEGTASLNPYFLGENPDPFPAVNRDVTPYGQPVYLMGAPGTTLNLTSGTITLEGGSVVPTTVLTSANDPQGRLANNQVFLVPTQALADNSAYVVSLTGTNTGMISSSNPTGAFTRSFKFFTGTFTTD